MLFHFSPLFKNIILLFKLQDNFISNGFELTCRYGAPA